MHMDVIDNLQRFEALRANWEAVYDADPDAQFFLSWLFMRDWLPILTGPWFILAAKPTRDASSYVAFFPLRLRTRERKDGAFRNEINMAGNYFADYTGFICQPHFDRAAIGAFAKHIAQMNWSALHLENMRISDARLKQFIACFSERKFSTAELDRINQPDNINNCICPFVTLPASWESYLNDSLSANTRQKVRRFLRQIEKSDTFRITQASADSIERDVKTLLRLWTARWASRKRDRVDIIVRSNFAALTSNFKNGSLFLPILWKNETPVGALASFIDMRKKSLLFYMAGRDEEFEDLPSGLVLHAYSIRYAIDNALTTYDFLRGNEPYKYSLGAEEQRIRCLRISTRSGRNLGDRLDPRSISDVLQRTIKLHQAGKMTEAEHGYRQVLDVEPGNAQALYCFAQLMASRGDHAIAKRLLKSLLKIKPDSCKIWLRLASSLEARSQLSEAAQAYREVIKRRPDIAVAHRKLGALLVKLGDYAGAVAAFDAALSLHPGDEQTAGQLSRALHVLEQARPSRRMAPRVRHNGQSLGSALD